MITYIPGDGWAVVADGTVALLPAGTDPGVVRALWETASAGGGVMDHLQVLLGPGITAVPPFALLRLEAGTAHVLVRGGVQVDVTTDEATERIGAESVTTWAERTVRGARAARVGAAEPAAGEPLPVLAAVVRAVEVRLDPRSAADQGQAGPAAVTRAVPPPPAPVPPAPAPAPQPMPEALPLHAPLTMPLPEPVGLEPVGLEPLDDDDADDDLLVVPTWDPVRTTGPAAAVSLPPVTGPTPVVAPAHVPQLEPSQDHDGLTVLSSDVAELRRQLPEWAGDAVPQLAVPTPRTPAPAKLLMSTGLVVSLNRPVLLGRAPQVTRVSNNEIPRLITVASPNQDISRTHAEVRMDGEDVVVTDLRSTNGVLLLRQGQGPQRLHPGEPTVVEPGVVVDLGEGVTFLVEAGG